MSGALLSLGSNLGDREAMLRKALSALSFLPKTTVLNTSFVYETKPVGYLNQQSFLNAVVLIDTKLSPKALLGSCLGIEAALGRKRNIKNGPRVIDIDLLLYQGVTCNSDELTIPHPRLAERAFVLIPLADIFPNGIVFEFNFSAQISKAFNDPGVVRYNNLCLDECSVGR
ncbi:MAG: 2-amino-4-hydroxy-6-hydroxymethyldihydropteridine diphosphokinase [Oscillospiraceae bacterium]|jgi:2-amino-4-hydroxy-6-hydroxymethyldihydropteridine diphosphokinase|nr:2-amino-4-hydroxy-6-hydroxymethyldihydropteridine diphosphokinase [Oscillospiraceae bacterium]